MEGLAGPCIFTQVKIKKFCLSHEGSSGVAVGQHDSVVGSLRGAMGRMRLTLHGCMIERKATTMDRKGASTERGGYGMVWCGMEWDRYEVLARV